MVLVIPAKSIPKLTVEIWHLVTQLQRDPFPFTYVMFQKSEFFFWPVFLIWLVKLKIQSKSSFGGIAPCSKIYMKSIHYYSSYCLNIRTMLVSGLLLQNSMS